jgi:hypothetical protein
MDTLRSEVDVIMKAEGITFCYGTVDSKPGQWAEAEYRPATKTIVIDEILKGYPDEYQDEPLTLAHELGHHFDSIRGVILSLSDDERERRADEYMVRLADKHGVGDRARALANYHRPGSYAKRKKCNRGECKAARDLFRNGKELSIQLADE